MGVQNMILWAAAVYFGFHLVRALLTGNAPLFRNRDTMRRDKPGHYWGFVALMAAMGALCLFFALRP
jgi:hypothetical protein